MRVLFATAHSYMPQRVGGAESSIHDLCLELSRRGHQVGVLASLKSQGMLALVNRVRRKLGGGRFPFDRRMGYRVYRGWSPAKGAPELLRRFSPAVVVVQGSNAVELARAFLDAGAQVALYVRDVEFRLLGGDIPRHERLLVLANSGLTANRVRETFGLHPAVLHPLVRPEAYRTETTREVALYVNPHPLKGVEIAFRLAEARPDIPFVFLQSWGLQPDRKREYLERAAALANVEWREPVRDMREVYGRARFILAPSVWEEGWGRVATEAQVSGIPVLASRRGALPESVGPGGILVDPEAPLETWLEALSRLWDDPEAYDRLSRAALEHSKRPEIQPDAIIEQFLKLLSDHAKARRQTPPME